MKRFSSALVALPILLSTFGCTHRNESTTSPTSTESTSPQPVGGATPTGSPSPGSKVEQGFEKAGEALGKAVDSAGEAITDASITGKIKSKFGLDDEIKALNINVDTKDGVVTLTGTAPSQLARERAVRLARETEGVKSVVDRLVVQP